jgi:hypothetical protein
MNLKETKLGDEMATEIGVATEALNRTWYERNTGRAVTTFSVGHVTLCIAGWPRR